MPRRREIAPGAYLQEMTGEWSFRPDFSDRSALKIAPRAAENLNTRFRRRPAHSVCSMLLDACSSRRAVKIFITA